MGGARSPDTVFLASPDISGSKLPNHLPLSQICHPPSSYTNDMSSNPPPPKDVSEKPFKNRMDVVQWRFLDLKPRIKKREKNMDAKRKASKKASNPVLAIVLASAEDPKEVAAAEVSQGNVQETKEAGPGDDSPGVKRHEVGEEHLDTEEGKEIQESEDTDHSDEEKDELQEEFKDKEDEYVGEEIQDVKRPGIRGKGKGNAPGTSPFLFNYS